MKKYYDMAISKIHHIENVDLSKFSPQDLKLLYEKYNRSAVDFLKAYK